MGRPTRLTPKVAETIIQAVRAGATISAACARAGIGESTYYEWVQRGTGTHKNRRANTVYAEFAEALARAEAELEVALVAQWRQQMPSDWRAVAEFLARRFPRDWGRRTEVTGAGGGPVEVMSLTDEDRKARMAEVSAELARRLG